MKTSRLELDHVEGSTRITRMVSRVPLRLLETGLHDHGVEIQLSSYGGGVLQGDQVELKIRCGELTGLLLKSQANTHVYRNEIGKKAVQRIEADCEPGSKVWNIPEPLVLHEGAIFRQEQIWNIAESTDFILADWMLSGRSESAEQFIFERYESYVLISVDGKAVVEENLSCYPAEMDIRSPAAFGPYDLLLNLYILGPKADEHAEKLQPFLDYPQIHTNALPEDRAEFPRKPVYALNPLPDGNGYLFRAMSRTRRELQPVINLFL
ncbi:urease accessory protein UreD [Pontiellaceae bacterium B1224]|nr:urease accessory protein UreD [Pontiellaceae bacterium B1224]